MTDFSMPLATTLGIEVVSTDKTLVVGRMSWRQGLCTTADVMHGGALMAFADTLGAICAFLNLPPGAGTSTIESKTNFFRPVTKDYVEGRSRPIHVGRTTICVVTELVNPEDKLVAQVTQTQAVRTS